VTGFYEDRASYKAGNVSDSSVTVLHGLLAGRTATFLHPDSSITDSGFASLVLTLTERTDAAFLGFHYSHGDNEGTTEAPYLWPFNATV
jgi:hypothetical protein